METRSNLRRAQSLRSVTTEHAPSWTEAGLRDRRKSVSQLVAEYQHSTSKPKAEEESKQKLLVQVSAISVPDTESKLQTLLDNNESKERLKTRAGHSTQSNLTRSKSMEFLPRHKTTGTNALKELYESKVAMQTTSDYQRKIPQKLRNTPSTSDVTLNHKVTKDPPEAGADSANINSYRDKQEIPLNDEKATLKEATKPRSERRKTVTGAYTEKTSFLEDDKRKSVADFRDISALYGQEKSTISVKALSALYLSKLAAVDPAGHLLKPEHNSTSSTRPKVIKMADVTQQDCEHHENVPSKDESTQSDQEVPLQPHCQPSITAPPSKEAISTLYQQRQKCEIKRLLKHTCPELKGLGNMVEEEFADMLSSGIATDTEYQGEVQSRRWIFENATGNAVDAHHTQWEQIPPYPQEGSIHGIAHSLFSSSENNGQTSTTPPNECVEFNEEGNFRVDVKATRKKFEGQSTDCAEDSFPGRVVISDEEKGAVQKQKKDFETHQTDSIKRNSPINLLDITDIHQDSGEVYAGISRAKEIFEKGSYEKEIVSGANEFCVEEEALKTNVRNRAHMFESTPLDRINQQNVEELDKTDESMTKTLASLDKFNVIHSHGTLVEACETAHVRKANYNLTESNEPNIFGEETVMGSMKSILLQLLAKTNLTSLITFLKEDKEGNVEIKNIDVPAHPLPFTANQDKECRTTKIIQIIEDLLGQETRPGRGILIQECEAGSIETLVYALFRHGVHDEAMMVQNLDPLVEVNRIDIQKDRNDDVIPKISSPSLTGQEDVVQSFSIDENRTSNVKLFRSCIEKGDLEYLKSLQRSTSDEDLREAVECEQKEPIALGNFKTIKALFNPIPENVGPCVASDRDLKEPTDDIMLLSSIDELPSPVKDDDFILEIENEEPGRKPYCKTETGYPDEDIVIQAERVDIDDNDELSNLQAAIESLQQATKEAKALQQSIKEKQTDTPLTNPETQTTDIAVIQGCISESLQNLENRQQQEEIDQVMKGSVQAALDSLGKSSFNVTKGDFRAAMIYRSSGKAYSGQKKTIVDETGDKQSGDVTALSGKSKACLSFSLPIEVDAMQQSADSDLCQGQITHMPSACSPPINQTNPKPTALKKNNKVLGPKPDIPPKPDHLKVNASSGTVISHGCSTSKGDLNKNEADSDSAFCPQPNEQQRAQPTTSKPKQGDDKALPNNQDVQEAESDKSLNEKQLNQVQITTHSVEGNEGESQTNHSTDMQNGNPEVPSEFHAALQNFGIKTERVVPPVKPKRIKMATNSTVLNTSPTHTANATMEDIAVSNDAKPTDSEHKEERQNSVTMREKKVRRESEEERRQRLSVHMDEIMRGNVMAAMEIFDKIREQEELKTILSKVEEIEEDTKHEHVSDLKEIFESVPQWVVPHNQSNAQVEQQNEGKSEKHNAETMSSMEVAFGDLERASAAIIILKEQTLSRLMEIEETIKKALYSVSTLKSDSDIVGLSGLFKESMMAVQGTPVSGNIRKISIGSSKSPKAHKPEVTGKSVSREFTKPVETMKPDLSPPVPKPKSGAPSSPSFISIQSAARKNTESPPAPNPQNDPQNSSSKAETYQSTMALTCYKVCPDHSPKNDKRQVSTLEVQTIPEGKTVIGTKTIRENYEETDHFGNRFYSSKSSTVVTTQPETKTCFKRQIMSSPATSEVVTFPLIKTTSINGNPNTL